MSWVRLVDLPGARVVHERFRDIVYWEVRDGAVWHQGRKLRSADVASFEVRRDAHPFLGRDASQLFHAWQTLKQVDRASFEVLSDGYCRDARLAYAEYETSLRPLKGQTVEGFAVLGNGYARDALHGYYCGTPLRACQAPLTLEVPHQDVHEGWPLPFAVDRDQVYFEAAALPGVDRATWRLLDRGFSRDGRSAFYCAKKLPRVHIESWELLDGSYSRDDRSVWTMFFRLDGADPVRWKPIDAHYSTDGTHLYYIGERLADVDVASFRVTRGKARDKRGTFTGAQRA